MKKKDIVSGKVIRMDFPNIGILEAEGEHIRVKNLIPGTEAGVQIQKARKGKYEGRAVEIIKESPLVKEEACPHFGICGGCLYGGVSYEDELEIKAGQVRRLLAPVIGEETFDSIFRGITGSPRDTGYRNKMEFSFGDEYKDGPLALGMHKRGAFYDIVTVSECRLVSEDYRKILLATLNFFKEKGTPFFNKNTHEGYLRHLLVRQSAFTGEILVDIVTASGIDKDLLKEYKESLLSLDLDSTLAGILHTDNDRISDVVEDQGTEVLYGEAFFTERLLSLSFKITPFSFFQTNSFGAEVLYSKIRELLPKSGTVYDLYCGTGTIGQLVSESAEAVVGVEIVREAVEAANENAKTNGITNTEFICGDVLKTLDDIEKKPDAIILDPPREGVNPKALKIILGYGVKNIIYVSCKPTSLARDLSAFSEAGYRVSHIECVDMFPKTGNVETICKLVSD